MRIGGMWLVPLLRACIWQARVDFSVWVCGTLLQALIGDGRAKCDQFLSGGWVYPHRGIEISLG